MAGAVLFTPWAFWLDAVFGLAAFDPLDADTDTDETLWSEFTNLAPVLVVVWLALNAGQGLRLQAPPGPCPTARP
ncbi:MAG: hypothetical protein AAF214_10775 [Pseudomonadota bacterium]